MAKFEKLLKDLLNMSADIRFDELKKILEFFGYKMRKKKSGTSHVVFEKEKAASIVIPRHSKIKKVYVKLVKEIVEEELKQNEKSKSSKK